MRVRQSSLLRRAAIRGQRAGHAACGASHVAKIDTIQPTESR